MARRFTWLAMLYAYSRRRNFKCLFTNRFCLGHNQCLLNLFLDECEGAKIHFSVLHETSVQLTLTVTCLYFKNCPHMTTTVNKQIN